MPAIAVGLSDWDLSPQTFDNIDAKKSRDGACGASVLRTPSLATPGGLGEGGKVRSIETRFPFSIGAASLTCGDEAA